MGGQPVLPRSRQTPLCRLRSAEELAGAERWGQRAAARCLRSSWVPAAPIYFLDGTGSIYYSQRYVNHGQRSRTGLVMISKSVSMRELSANPAWLSLRRRVPFRCEKRRRYPHLPHPPFSACSLGNTVFTFACVLRGA